MAAQETQVVKRYALVTGASSGIGKACCEALVGHNASLKGYKYVVFGVARNKDKLSALGEQLNKNCDKDDVNFIGIPFDLNNIDKYNQLWETIEKHTKYISILINNAGLSFGGRGLTTLSTDQILNMINVNITGLTLLSREGLTRMQKHMPINNEKEDSSSISMNDGFIINICSVVGHVIPSGGSGLYSATKHFVRALTEGLRKEVAEKSNMSRSDDKKDRENENALKQNVHIGMISPGIVNTPFFSVRHNDLSKGQAFVDSKPHLLPKDVTDAMLYIIKQPQHANICEVLIRPRLQVT